MIAEYQCVEWKKLAYNNSHYYTSILSTMANFYCL